MATRVVIGGTFAIIHKGHLRLIEKAFRLGDMVYIGLTSDAYVLRHKITPIKEYSKRKRELHAIAKRFSGKTGARFSISRIDDRYGPSTTGNFDVIVVSQETYGAAREINRIRKAKGLKQLKIVKVSYALAYDKKPISSTRIAFGEIDEEGGKVA